MTSPRAILIGLDGMTFDLIDPFMDEGIMPFLKSMTETGTRATLRTIVPALTPPAWTSLLTGRTPGHHGIFDFFQLEAPGSKQIRLATASDVRCPTVGHLANRHGRHAAMLNFPVTFPPPALDGYVIAGWMPWRQLRLGCHPADLYDEMKQIPGFNPRELAMDMALEARATEGCDEDEYIEWVELHIRREQHWLDVIRHLMQTRPTDFTAILLDGPDKVQHLCWRFLDPSHWPENPSPHENRIRDLCLDYYRQLDTILEEITRRAGLETTVVLASDHGFGATTEVFHINSWLAQEGYLHWAKQPESENTGILGMGQLARHTYSLDWDQTLAYAATPTSNGIHIVRVEDNDGKGIPADAYESFRAELADRLYQFIDPATGERIVSRICFREEIFPGPAGGVGPDLTLILRDGGLVSILPSDNPLNPRSAVAGTHRPEGIFIAKGPGIRQGFSIPECSILDVSPTLLYGLGLPIPEDLEGRLPVEMFEPSFLSEHPVQTEAVTSSDTGFVSKAGDAYDEEAEAVIVTRLRELGYLD